MMMNHQCGVVIVAAGGGTRMGEGPPKQYRELLGIPLFLWPVRFFNAQDCVSEIVIVAPSGDEERIINICRVDGMNKVARVTAGGVRRQDSVAAGIAALSENVSIAAVHDAARPFPPSDFADAVQSAGQYGAVIYAARISETIKRAGKDLLIEETIDRENLWGAQTPQIFQRSKLEDALRFCQTAKQLLTDEALTMEVAGYEVKIIPAPRTNIKVTTSDDWPLAEAMARCRS
ncbi:MAG: 2-C-methyl-D-erythritol 4-phosphate cytidylyltransferase [bacterium]|nr:2-C-methyl-D-erythritol 4-phosphate cytidylyltransferase [Candidatus Sumerlaeota bacterium]